MNQMNQTKLREKLANTSARPLLPNWASLILLVLAATAVLSLTWNLAAQNRQLREAVAGQDNNVGAPRAPAVGDRIPLISLSSSDGDTRDSLDLLDGGGVVAFLTTTCPYCKASLPIWEQLSLSLDATGIPFVAVSLHNRQQTREFVASNGVEFPVWVVVDPSKSEGLQVSAVPVTAFVAASGEVTRIWRGQVREEDLYEIVRTAEEGRDH